MCCRSARVGVTCAQDGLRTPGLSTVGDSAPPAPRDRLLRTPARSRAASAGARPNPASASHPAAAPKPWPRRLGERGRTCLKPSPGLSRPAPAGELAPLRPPRRRGLPERSES